jgi:hypothetical protein
LLSFATEAPCQKYASVESAEFQRGADVSTDVFDSGRAAHYGPDWDEGPRHKVAVSAFRIARKQVSMKELVRFMPEYRKRIESAGLDWHDESPAVLVSWNEADAYCRWLVESTDQNYRLPTEAEWELAAGNSVDLKLEGIADGVQEWCLDWWQPYSMELENSKDPRGPSYGSLVRVCRDGGGGSVEEEVDQNESLADFRVTDRSATVPDDRRTNLGFRVVIGKEPEFTEASEVTPKSLLKVSNALPDWNESKKDEPYFWAGGKFIDSGGEGKSTVVPYWSRHHVPSLTWCDNGDLLATAFTAPFDNSDQMAILIARLPYGKEKWTKAERFFVAPDHNVTSAALFRAGENLIHHYNGLGSNHCDDFSMIKRESRDNGVTWSPPKIVHRFSLDSDSPGPRLWPHMDLKSLKSDGERVLVMSTDVAGDNDSGSALFISRDEGESWSELTRTGSSADNFALKGKSAGWIAGIHAPVETLADGSLMAFGRSNNIDGFAPMSRSFDFGKTWTYSASPFPPILSGQRSAMLRLKEGPLLFVSFTDTAANVREKKRVGMKFRNSDGNQQTGYGTFAAISEDDGMTWSHRKLIPNWHRKPWRSRVSGYLSCVQSPDGLIHLVSSSHYYRFNLAWLQEPMASP